MRIEVHKRLGRPGYSVREDYTGRLRIFESWLDVALYYGLQHTPKPKPPFPVVVRAHDMRAMMRWYREAGEARPRSWGNTSGLTIDEIRANAHCRYRWVAVLRAQGWSVKALSLHFDLSCQRVSQMVSLGIR